MKMKAAGNCQKHVERMNSKFCYLELIRAHFFLNIDPFLSGKCTRPQSVYYMGIECISLCEVFPVGDHLSLCLSHRIRRTNNGFNVKFTVKMAICILHVKLKETLGAATNFQ